MQIVNNPRNEATVKPHLQRMHTEYGDLGLKVIALQKFLKGDVFQTLAPKKQARLKAQLGHMEGYLWELGQRIKEEGDEE